MTDTKDNHPSITKIDGIQSNVQLPSMTEGQWSSVLKEFNPLGHIADMYARTLAYKIETKRLDAELKRIEIQAAIAHDVIDKTFQLKMEQLLQKRASLMISYQAISTELDNLHLARMDVLKMAQIAQQQAFAPALSLEERQMAKDMAMEMVRELPRFGEQAYQTLQQLVQALPPVEIPPKLLS